MSYQHINIIKDSTTDCVLLRNHRIIAFTLDQRLNCFTYALKRKEFSLLTEENLTGFLRIGALWTQITYYRLCLGRKQNSQAKNQQY